VTVLAWPIAIVVITVVLWDCWRRLLRHKSTDLDERLKLMETGYKYLHEAVKDCSKKVVSLSELIGTPEKTLADDMASLKMLAGFKRR